MSNSIQKIWGILDRRNKKKALGLGVLMIATNILDLVSIASILPLFSVIGRPEVIQEQPLLAHLYDTLGFTSTHSFMLAMSWGVLFVILLTSIMQAFSQTMAFHFAEIQRKNISTKILGFYLKRDYEFFTRSHSSDLTKNILSEVDMVVSKCIIPFMLLMTSTLQTVVVVGLVVYLEPVIAFTVFAITSFIFIILFVFLKKRITKYGERRLYENQKRYKIIKDVFDGIKDVKINHLEKPFSSVFDKTMDNLCRVSAANESLAIVPRYGVQVIVLGGIIALLIVMLTRYGDLQSALPTLGLFAIAGVKTIPAIYSMYNSMAKIKFGMASLDHLKEELNTLEKEDTEEEIQITDEPALPFEKDITIKNASFVYPGTKKKILDNVSMNIPAGKTIGIIGRSGAGKSTIIDIILGLHPLEDGKLKVDDVLITRDNRQRWQKSIGYVPQSIFLMDQSIAENIAFGYDRDKIDHDLMIAAAKKASIHDFIFKELPDQYETPVGDRGIKLSGGQRQRIGIAKALYKDPAVLIFDEATSAIDTLTENAIIEEIYGLRGQKTIIMIAHRLDTVKNCDYIYLMDQGRIVAQGTYSDLEKDSDHFKKMIGRKK